MKIKHPVNFVIGIFCGMIFMISIVKDRDAFVLFMNAFVLFMNAFVSVANIIIGFTE